MASINVNNGTSYQKMPYQKNYTFALTIMLSLYFVIGFITVMNDVLIPSLKSLFDLKDWQAMLVQFCFFIAYGIMSYPSGIIVEKIGYKKGLTLALWVMGLGLFLFIPASKIISYPFFLFSLFIVASGLTILQVALNPYIIYLGPKNTAAARMSLGGALNSLATFIGPIIGGAFILIPEYYSAEIKAEAVKIPYIGLSILTLLIGLIIYKINLPEIFTAEKISNQNQKSIFKHRNLVLGAIGIFMYVGAEVAIGSMLILYLKEMHLIKIDRALLPIEIENVSDEKIASSLLAFYWGCAMIGRFIGSFLGQFVKDQNMLRIVSAFALILVMLSISGLFNNNYISLHIMLLHTENIFNISFPLVQIPLSVMLLILVGLMNSVMWPCIFPLALEGLGNLTSKGSGLLVMMVAGGGIIPVLQGILKDFVGYQNSFLIVGLCYLYILFFSLHGYKVRIHEKLSNLTEVLE
jgi:FHS family L-fucose permease-like MFS transporter